VSQSCGHLAQIACRLIYSRIVDRFPSAETQCALLFANRQRHFINPLAFYAFGPRKFSKKLLGWRVVTKDAKITDLKSVLAKSEVWVRIPSSAPLRTQFFILRLVRFYYFSVCAWSRTKTHEKTVYSSSISQAACDVVSARALHLWWRGAKIST
jgi:hypothetical protein